MKKRIVFVESIDKESTAIEVYPVSAYVCCIIANWLRTLCDILPIEMWSSIHDLAYTFDCLSDTLLVISPIKLIINSFRGR